MTGKSAFLLSPLLALGAQLLSSCGGCMTIPDLDEDDPVATLTVIFEDAAGQEVVEYVNTSDQASPVNVEVPSGNSFQILYAGSDKGGIEALTLDWKYSRNNEDGTATVVQPVILPDYFSDCPETYQLLTRDLAWESEARQWEFVAIAQDFHENRATTPAITVRHGQ